ncbi:MAG: manganese efflux pump MntP family protein [Succinivibrio sp.]|nr:manganese efflux pump MntP family protein [Succinivibrio sp.]
MTVFESLSIAFSLSVDACVIALLYGQLAQEAGLRFRLGLKLALTFGFCQFLMPLIGCYGGQALLDLIDTYDHWVAFALLALVSLNMLKEAFAGESRTALSQHNAMIFILGLATSLDALAVGFSLGLVYDSLFSLALIIGLTCFGLVLATFYLSSSLKQITVLNRSMNIVGALILLLIGVLILREHDAFAFLTQL